MRRIDSIEKLGIRLLISSEKQDWNLLVNMMKNIETLQDLSPHYSPFKLWGIW
jgi:hypothetical protein